MIKLTRKLPKNVPNNANCTPYVIPATNVPLNRGLGPAYDLLLQPTDRYGSILFSIGAVCVRGSCGWDGAKVAEEPGTGKLGLNFNDVIDS